MIELLTLDEAVTGPPGIVFSPAPKLAVGADGKTYFVKGWNEATAFSEVAGCRLASEVGLPVPRAEVCRFQGDLCAGSEEVPHCIRTIAPWLARTDGIANLKDLFAVIAVDTWLANDDRNMGNLIGSPAGEGRIALSMIDFEKSKTLGALPTIHSASVGPRRLWPTGELGGILRQRKPVHLPAETIARISGISRQRISEIVWAVAAELAFVDWAESSIDVLAARALRIHALLEEVWLAN